jgi:hypothetical protein
VLDHLLTIEYEPEVDDAPADGFVPMKKLDTAQLLEGQIGTTDWLKELGASTDEEVLEQAQENIARDAFKALVANPTQAKTALSQVTLPPAIQKIVGMLTAYDWAFVEQARELRGMAVAKIVEETDHPDARIRLKALELLGKVTEVGLFTERISVKKEDITDAELDEKIREKLAQLQKTVDAEATEIKDEDVEDVEDTTAEAQDDDGPTE